MRCILSRSAWSCCCCAAICSCVRQRFVGRREPSTGSLRQTSALLAGFFGLAFCSVAVTACGCAAVVVVEAACRAVVESAISTVAAKSAIIIVRKSSG